MRSIIFYLVVGFITFGIGFLGCFSYLQWKGSKTQSDGFKRMEKVKSLQKMPEHIESLEKPSDKNKDFKCENQYLLAVWNHLQKDKDYKELFKKGNKITDCSEVFGISDAIDLNNDGNKEAVVSDNGWRNGVFSQSFWIVRKIGNDYKIILVGKDLEYEIRNQTTNGFRDLILSFKDSLEEYEKSLFKFDGKSYKPKKCWNEIIAARNQHEQLYMFRKPRITPISCNVFANYFTK